MDRHEITNGRLSAAIKADGAELCSLRDTQGRELLWQAGPAWPRHAPVLFPIVGRLKDDRLRHAGRDYRLTQHGFARDRRFAWEEQGPAACRLSLTDDDWTRERYPFAFRFEMAYALEGDSLTVRHRLSNPGTEALPASIGGHPAFRWPLIGGLPKTAHELVFETDEPAPIRRVTGGLLTPDHHPTPIRGRRLPLDEGLFADDAVILDQPASRSVRYTAPGAPAIEVSWDGFEQLGVWSKAGGDFLCIEPWHGHASPTDFDGPFTDKPGLLHLVPGETRELTYRITLGI
ncbi:aldose 1-epimerase family protein [Azospirillum soli]|uniref:aldose 1-epimerase family protein n=1 Tax=Azospirillum soli TaxID=1304799 RepID=UPI001AE857B4|nr:aldose 1-epimerase family protein [Azospirillum soli]MBP2315627.1 galactose mutarotase-like enzyme [Azospirillum soli]